MMKKKLLLKTVKKNSILLHKVYARYKCIVFF